MAPPHDGNEFLPFADMIALEKINDNTYRSKAMPFSPGGSGRAYGGHVYAQAVWAAAQTVKTGFVVHVRSLQKAMKKDASYPNRDPALYELYRSCSIISLTLFQNVTGWFTLAGLTNVPFVYSVKTIRDGRSYCTRIVHVTQAEGKGICFTCTCSFKLPEDSPLDVQEEIDLDSQYSIVLKGQQPTDFEHTPGMDVPWYEPSPLTNPQRTSSHSHPHQVLATAKRNRHQRRIPRSRIPPRRHDALQHPSLRLRQTPTALLPRTGHATSRPQPTRLRPPLRFRPQLPVHSSKPSRRGRHIHLNG